ncbi:hypothetical protein ACWDSL_20980 [Streptomyces sp. NPDC000941]
MASGAWARAPVTADNRPPRRGSGPLTTFRGAAQMPDLLFIAVTVVVFAVIGLVAKGAGRL